MSEPSQRYKDAVLDMVVRRDRECRSCGELLYRDQKNGSNLRVKCPECGKEGCTICVEMTETGTCCCVPE